MARGRMINRSVTESVAVDDYGAELGALAWVFHHRLIAFLDKNGNVRADPLWLKVNLFPRVDQVTPEDCRKYAAGLVRHGLAVLYEADRRPCLHFPGFRDHQVGLRADREKAEVPVPQGFDEDSGKMPELFRKPAGYMPPEVEVELEVEQDQTRSSKEDPAVIPESAPPDVDNVGITSGDGPTNGPKTGKRVGSTREQDQNLELIGHWPPDDPRRQKIERCLEPAFRQVKVNWRPVISGIPAITLYEWVSDFIDDHEHYDSIRKLTISKSNRYREEREETVRAP